MRVHKGYDRTARPRWMAWLVMLVLAAPWVTGDPNPGPDLPPRLLPGVEPLAGGGWRVRAETRAGRAYRLERWNPSAGSQAGIQDWVPLVTVRAAGDLTAIEDPTAAGVDVRFYRLALLPEGGPDQIPPTLGPITAVSARGEGGLPMARLSVLATDDHGVSSVSFLGGDELLGEGGVSGDGVWSLEVPLARAVPEVRSIFARARDAAGNVGLSAPLHLALIPPSQITALDANGVPRRGTLPLAGADERLPPFDYRPGGPDLLGEWAAFHIRFPKGARVVRETGEAFFEFTEAAASFGPGHPLQFAAPLTFKSANPSRLPIGPLRLEELAAAFRIPAASGWPVVLFGRWHLTWLAGVVADGQIRGSRFRMEETGLPLPSIGGGFPEFPLEFSREAGLRLPFHGEFNLVDDQQVPMAIRVSRQRPLWAALRPDGSLGLSGRVECSLPNGTRFMADVRLEDPYYHLKIAATGLELESFLSLKDALPMAPDQCVPGAGVADEGKLDAAARCLLSYREAYRNYAAGVASLVPEPAGNVSDGMPPEDVNLAVAALEAWAHSALTPAGNALNPEPLGPLIEVAARGAAAARTVDQSMALQLGIRRAVGALEGQGIPASPALQAQIREAVGAADAAVAERLRSGHLADTFEEIQSLVERFGPVADLRTAACPGCTLDFPKFLRPAADALGDYLEQQAGGLGVKPGEFVPGAPVQAMDPIRAVELFRLMVAVRGTWAVLDLGVNPQAPRFRELANQLVRRITAAAVEELHRGEDEFDFGRARLLLNHLTWIVAQRQVAGDTLFGAGPHTATLPDVALIDRERESFERIFVVARAMGGTRLDSVAPLREELRVLSGLLHVLPEDVKLAPSFYRLAWTEAEGHLERLATAGNSRDLGLLQEFLEAGAFHYEVGLRRKFTTAKPWLTGRLPVIVGRIADVARERRDSAAVDRAVRFLMEQADFRSVRRDQAGRREYLLQAARLLAASRDVVLALIGQAGDRTREFDLALPGEVHVDRVAGALGYNRRTRVVDGAFSGRLRLPQMGLALDIPGASMRSGGEFDLTASGSLDVPAKDSFATLSIPARRPLHLGWRRAGGLRASGGVHAEFDNGLAFDAFLGLEDPLYRFELAAGGFTVDLLDRVTLIRPQLAADAVPSVDLGRALNEFFASFNSALEQMNALPAAGPGAGEVPTGSPPQFRSGPTNRPSAAANAVLLGMRARAQDPVPPKPEVLADLFRNVAAWLGDTAQAAAADWKMRREANEQLDFELSALEDVSQSQKSLAGTFKELAEKHLLDGQGLNPLADPDFARSMASQADALASLMKLPLYRTNGPAAMRLSRLLMERAGTIELLGGNWAADPASGATGPYLGAVYVQTLRRLGFDPANGSQVDPTVVNVLSAEEIIRAAKHLSDLAANAAAFDSDGPAVTFQAVAERLAVALRHRILAELRPLQPSDWEAGLHWLDLLARTWVENEAGILLLPRKSNVEQFGGPDAPFDLNAEVTAMARLRFGFEAERNRRLRAAELERRRRESEPFHAVLADLHALGKVNLTAEVLDPIQQAVQAGIDRLTSDFLKQRWSRSQLAGAEQALEDLAGYARRAAQLQFESQAQALATETVPQFADRAAAAAVEFNDWSLPARVASRAYEEVAGSLQRVENLRQAFAQAAASQLQAAQKIARTFDRVRVDLKPVDLRLPGDLLVRRVAGAVSYHRNSGALMGLFSGLVEFPEIGREIFFSIDQALVSNAGQVDIRATGRFPVGPGARLEAGLHYAADAVQVREISGAGKFLLDTPQLRQTNEVTFAWDNVGHVAEFTGNSQGLDLVFAEDFVLLGGGFGVRFDADHRSGRLSLNGTAGLFARAKPLPKPLSAEAFQLVVDNLSAFAEISPDALTLGLDRGRLLLPEFFNLAAGACPAPTQPGLALQASTSPKLGPALALSPGNGLRVKLGAGTVSVSGDLQLEHFGLAVPGLQELALEVCSARMQFPSGGAPVLTNLSATLRLPVASRSAPVTHIDLKDAAWTVGGFPQGTIGVREGLTLLDSGGFALRFLGAADPDGNGGTRLTISNSPTAGYRLEGALQFQAPVEALTTGAGDRLKITGQGHLDGNLAGPPSFTATGLAFRGDLHLGGAGGMLVQDSALKLLRLDNLGRLSRERPFVVELSGTVVLPSGGTGLGFGLEKAQFIFTDEPVPDFDLNGLSFKQEGDGNLEAHPGFFVGVREVTLRGRNPDLRFPEKLRPDNLQLILSGSMGFPLPDGGVFGGEVDKLAIQFENGLPTAHLNGLALGVDGVEVPPVSLSGRVFITGLDHSAGRAAAPAGPLPAGPPAPRSDIAGDLLFAGKLGGTLMDVGATAEVAFTPKGFLGICLDVKAGPAGIPLGPTGLILNGAEGGVSFDGAVQPCEFTKTLKFDSEGRPQLTPASRAALAAGVQPGLTWERVGQRTRDERLRRALDAVEAAVERTRQLLAAQSARRAAARASGHPGGSEPVPDDVAFPCPTRDCPPVTLPIYCEPHPMRNRPEFAGRSIIRFTSLDERLLNTLGLRKDTFAGLNTAEEIATKVRETVLDFVAISTPRPSAGLPGADEINQALDGFLQVAGEHIFNAVRGAVDLALQGQGTVYGAVVHAAEAGVECPQVSTLLSGSVTFVPISPFLSANVGVVVSPFANEGLVGKVNLMGVPVGDLKAFNNLTDENGLPNPSFCGELLATLGPLELGRGKFDFHCDGCVTETLGAFGRIVGCVAESRLRAAVDRVLPGHGGEPLATVLSRMNDTQKFGLLAELMSRPPEPAQQACVVEALASLLPRMQPSLAFCAKGAPKLFGIPLGGDVFEGQFAASKTNLAGGYGFSPTYMIGNAMLMVTPASGLFPALDKGSISFNVDFPDSVLEAAVRGDLATAEGIARYAEEGFERMLQGATFGMSYTLYPLGFEIGKGAGRAIMPDLLNHPVRLGPGFKNFEQRFPNLPSRTDLVLAALEANLLGNALWRGRADDIHLAFPQGDARRAALKSAGVSLLHDYFPHGGVVGGLEMKVPRIVREGVPADLMARLNDPKADLFAKLPAVMELVQEHILAQSKMGDLAFYVPAPNPPVLNGPDGKPLSPRALLDSLTGFDFSQVRSPNLYALDQAFLRGYFDGKLLGIPTGRANVEAVGANGKRGPYMEVSAEVPPDSWFAGFLDRASMKFVLDAAPPRPLEQSFGDAVKRIEPLLKPGADARAVAQAFSNVVGGFVTNLPKVAFDLQVEHLRIPAPIDQLVQAGGSGRLVGYSLAYDPSTPDTGPLSRARRDGGIALQASLQFGSLLSVENAELGLTAPSGLAPLRLSGLFDIPRAGLLRNLRAQFDSQPPVGKPFLAATGVVDGFELRNPVDQSLLAALRPLQPNASSVTGHIDLTHTAGGVSAKVLIQPALLDLAFLGPGTQVQMDGGTDGEDFSFDSQGPWSARVTLRGTFELRDPNPATGRPVLLRVAFPKPGDVAHARLAGDGLVLTAFDVTFPLGATLEILPALALAGPFPVKVPLGLGGGAQATLKYDGDRFEITATPFPLGAELRVNPGRFLVERTSSAYQLRIESPEVTLFPGTDFARAYQGFPDFMISSDGRFRLNQSFTQASPLLLPGLFTGEGDLEIGNEPGQPVASIEVSPASLDFGGIAIHRSSTRALSVRNTGLMPVALDFGTSALGIGGRLANPFTVSPAQLNLGPGQSASVTVTFAPAAKLAYTGSIRLSDEGVVPAVTVPAKGSGQEAPEYFQSVASLDFGTVPVGHKVTRDVRVLNRGVGDLRLISATVPAGFSVNPAIDGTELPSGASALFRVAFVSGVPGSFGASGLAITANDGAPPHFVGLAAAAFDRRWIVQHQGGEDLRALVLQADGDGWAVGENGAMLRTSNAGLQWRPSPRRVTSLDLYGAAAQGENLAFVGGRGIARAAFHSANFGNTWAPTSPASSGLALERVWDAVGYNETGHLFLAGHEIVRVLTPLMHFETRSTLRRQTTPGDDSSGADVLTAAAGMPVAPVFTGTGRGYIALGSQMYESIDSGQSWTRVSAVSGRGGDWKGLAMAGSVLVAVGENGLLARRSSGGTWTVTTNPLAGSGFTCVAARGTNVVAGTADGAALLSATSGLFWSREELPAPTVMRSAVMTAAGSWGAGDGGVVLFRPPSPPTAPVIGAGVAGLDFGHLLPGQTRTIPVEFFNRGVTELVISNAAAGNRFSVFTTLPLRIAPGASVPVRVRYAPEASVAALGTHTRTLTFTSNGSATPLALSVRGEANTNAPLIAPGYLFAPAINDAGTIPVGVDAAFTLATTNLGPGTVRVGSVRVLGLDADVDGSVTGHSDTVLTSGQVDRIGLSIRARRAGAHRLRVTIDSDAFDDPLTCEVWVVAEVPPTSVTLATEPPGLSLVLNRQSLAAPVLFGIGDAAGAAVLAVGSSNGVAAPAEQTLHGVRWRFVRWSGSAGAEQSFVAGTGADRYTATYERVFAPPGPALVAGRAASPAGPALPPAGLYLRLSNGRLRHPLVGAFEATGDVFLSATRIRVALASKPLSLPDGAAKPVMRISDGEWLFDYLHTPVITRTELRVGSPSIEFFGHAATPGADLRLAFSGSAEGAKLEGDFSVEDALALVPNVVEFGPGGATHFLVKAAATPVVELSTHGTLRALKRPDNSWTVEETFDFKAGNGPFKNVIPLRQPLLSTPFLSVGPSGAASALEFSRDAGGAVTLAATDLRIEGFGQVLEHVGGGVEGSALSLELEPSFKFGKVRYTANSAASAVVDFAKLGFAVKLPAGSISATGVAGWPSNKSIPVNRTFEIDTLGDFDLTVPLPDLTFDGFELPGDADSTSRSYVRFARADGLLNLRLQARASWVGNDLGLRFDMRQDGAVSGVLSGAAVVRDVPVGFPGRDEDGDLTLGRVNLGYESGRVPRFKGHVQVGPEELRSTLDAQFAPGRLCFGLLCVP